MFASLYAYRSFIWGSIRRDFTSRYRQSVLGALWAFVFPLTTVLVYVTVFTSIMRPKLPGSTDEYAYGVYLIAGFVAWSLFADLAGRANNMFLEHANLLKKLAFPRLCLPIIVLGSALIHFFILLVALLIVLSLVGHPPTGALIGVVPAFVVLIPFGLGLGVLFGVVNVFIRDAGHFLTVLLQFWFWLTPIIYPPGILPEWARPIVDWNPMTPIVKVYQQAFLDAPTIDLEGLWVPAVWACLLCVLALVVFRKNSASLVDQL